MVGVGVEFVGGGDGGLRSLKCRVRRCSLHPVGITEQYPVAVAMKRVATNRGLRLLGRRRYCVLPRNGYPDLVAGEQLCVILKGNGVR